MGCDGVLEPNQFKRKHYDACGVCGGDGSTCPDCSSKVIHASWPNAPAHYGDDDESESESESEEDAYELENESYQQTRTYSQGFMVPMPLGELSVNEWYNYNGNNDRSFGGSGLYPARPRTLRILMVEDVSGRSFFVFLLSSGRHGTTRGQAWLSVGSNMTGFPVTVQVEDDPHGDGDLYNYDEATVSGLFKFRWQRYETDGFVLGPCPEEEDLCLRMGIERASNIDGISLVTWDAEEERLKELIPDYRLLPIGEYVQLCTRCSTAVDCAGIFNGDTVVDACNVCGGNGNSCWVGTNALGAGIGAVVMFALFCFVGALFYGWQSKKAKRVLHQTSNINNNMAPYKWGPVPVSTTVYFNDGSLRRR